MAASGDAFLSTARHGRAAPCAARAPLDAARRLDPERRPLARGPRLGVAARAVGLVLLAALAGPLAEAARADVRPEEFRAHVTKLRDGDSMEMRRGGKTIRVRVFGIDAPERGQPFSSKSRQLTAALVGNQDVVVRVKDRDRYGRIVGEVVLLDGRNLGEELVRAGLAWHYRFYSSDATLARLETEARAARRGLWADPHPTPPWEFRRGGREDRRSLAPGAERVVISASSLLATHSSELERST